jgi:hypothetical protein
MAYRKPEIINSIGMRNRKIPFARKYSVKLVRFSGCPGIVHGCIYLISRLYP